MPSINLRALAKQYPHIQRMRKRARVLGLKRNRAVELWYKVELLKVTRTITSKTEGTLGPVLQSLSSQWVKDGVIGDGYSADLEQTFEDLSASFGGLRQTAQRLSKLAAQRSAERVDESLKAAIEQSMKIDITVALTSEALTKVMEDAIVANTELIKSIATQYLGRVKNVVYQATSNGMRWESIVEEIKNEGLVAEKRAKVIARDQVSKMNGSFNKARQESLGIGSYYWQTSGDERVRATHANNDGKIFKWSDPPTTGHPGHDVLCRCVALPYFDLDDENSTGE